MSRYVEAQEALGGVPDDSEAIVTNSFWDNFFVQAGIGMSLQNPYGTNFANVFPNGHTFGINLGLGTSVEADH